MLETIPGRYLLTRRAKPSYSATACTLSASDTIGVDYTQAGEEQKLQLIDSFTQVWFFVQDLISSIDVSLAMA